MCGQSTENGLTAIVLRKYDDTFLYIVLFKSSNYTSVRVCCFSLVYVILNCGGFGMLVGQNN